MKEKLKKMNFRLTELANYLNLSRPTLYKYIEEYEKRKYKDIDITSRKVFDFIKKKTTYHKIQVIDFIIQLGKDNSSEELNKLFESIDEHKELKDELIKDIHQIGVKGVINKIQLIYKKKEKKE